MILLRDTTRGQETLTRILKSVDQGLDSFRSLLMAVPQQAASPVPSRCRLLRRSSDRSSHWECP